MKHLRHYFQPDFYLDQPWRLVVLVVLLWLSISGVVFSVNYGKPVAAVVDGESVLLADSTDGSHINVYKDYVLIAEYNSSDPDYADYEFAYTDNKLGYMDYLQSVNVLVVLAVIIGLFVTPSVALRQARATSIVQFRQKWITEIREIICELDAAHCEFMLLARKIERIKDKDGAEDEYNKAIERNKELSILMLRLATDFQLHLNPNESEHGSWESSLINLRAAVIICTKSTAGVSPSGVSDFSDVNQRLSDFIEISRRELKKEWETTKKFKG